MSSYFESALGFILDTLYNHKWLKTEHADTYTHWADCLLCREIIMGMTRMNRRVGTPKKHADFNSEFSRQIAKLR